MFYNKKMAGIKEVFKYGRDGKLQKSTDYTQSEGYAKLIIEYAPEMARGFRFYTNIIGQGFGEQTFRNLDAQVAFRKSEYEAKGLEVFVGNTAFDADGKIRKDAKVILVRDKKPDTTK